LTGLFENRIRELHASLGLAEEYVDTCKLPLQQEAQELFECENDIFGRKPMVTPHTFACWQSMRNAAKESGIELLIVSAFRSIEYQYELIKSKLEKGLTIEEILKVNAAPGFSEHHTGCALDLTTDNCEPLSEDFDRTAAFDWLTRNAADHSFNLSFPRNNPFGIIYEPWHWACRNQVTQD